MKSWRQPIWVDDDLQPTLHQMFRIMSMCLWIKIYIPYFRIRGELSHMNIPLAHPTYKLDLPIGSMQPFHLSCLGLGLKTNFGAQWTINSNLLLGSMLFPELLFWCWMNDAIHPSLSRTSAWKWQPLFHPKLIAAGCRKTTCAMLAVVVHV